MKQVSLSGLALVLSGGLAWAHPGEHAFSAAASLVHLLTEPDHLAMAAVTVGAAALLWKWRKSRA